MSVGSLTPVDEVIRYLISRATCNAVKEVVPIKEAIDRVLAADIVSCINVPLVDNSAMDGYAINTEHLHTESGTKNGVVLPLSDRIPAGTTGRPLVPGTAARIFTGAPVPAGANAVIIQENTELVGDEVRLLKLPAAGDNIRTAGQDINEGAVILSQGRRLRAQDLGLITSVGLDRVEVYRRLKIAILSTGDELVEPPQKLKPGQIYSSNHHTLCALITQLGMLPVDLGPVADTLEATVVALQQAAQVADCILTTGGVSVGDEDHVKAAVARLGKIDLWRLAIKPGKPLAFGDVAGKPFFGLPGNPVSSFVTFMMIARPFLLKYQGCSELSLRSIYANANFSRRKGSRREYLRVRVDYDENGLGTVRDFSNQGSGIMSSISWADALAEIEVDQAVEVGDLVKVYLLS